MPKSVVLSNTEDSRIKSETCERSEEKSHRSPEMANFEDALRQIMQVSKEDLKKIQAEEEAEKADKPKRGPKPTAKS
jgi:hypothetical protein